MEELLCEQTISNTLRSVLLDTWSDSDYKMYSTTRPLPIVQERAIQCRRPRPFIAQTYLRLNMEQRKVIRIFVEATIELGCFLLGHLCCKDGQWHWLEHSTVLPMLESRALIWQPGDRQKRAPLVEAPGRSEYWNARKATRRNKASDIEHHGSPCGEKRIPKGNGWRYVRNGRTRVKVNQLFPLFLIQCWKTSKGAFPARLGTILVSKEPKWTKLYCIFRSSNNSPWVHLAFDDEYVSCRHGYPSSSSSSSSSSPTPTPPSPPLPSNSSLGGPAISSTLNCSC